MTNATIKISNFDFCEFVKRSVDCHGVLCSFIVCYILSPRSRSFKYFLVLIVNGSGRVC